MDGDEKLKATTMYLSQRQLDLLDKWAKEDGRPRASMLRRLVEQEETRREAKREAA